MLLPFVLGSSPHLPVSVCGTGIYIQYSYAFLAAIFVVIRYFNFSLYLAIRVFPFPRLLSYFVSHTLFKYIYSAGILTCCPSDTPLGLSLGPDLPWADEPSPGNLRLSTGRILTFLSLLIPAFSLLSRPAVLSVYLRPTIECSSTTYKYLAIFITLFPFFTFYSFFLLNEWLWVRRLQFHWTLLTFRYKHC